MMAMGDPSAFPRIDRYEVREGLGRGAMGSVYRALDQKMGREVAIKLLDARMAAENEKHVQRFEREARAIAALKHPNIVDLYDYGRAENGQLYLVMELIEGSHTGGLFHDYGPLPDSVVAALAYELGRGLQVAHAASVIHRDIKPENVFLDRGRVVLADFGIAKAIKKKSALGGADGRIQTDIVGTPGFMAPEQVEQLSLDGRTDLFAFGALLYWLLTGETAFDGKTPWAMMKQFREERPIPVEDRRPGTNPALSRLIQDCLEVQPSARPKDIDAVRERLRDILDEMGVVYPRELLAAYEKAPDLFPEVDRERRIRVLIDQLKIAVYERNARRARTLRQQLDTLAPDWNRDKRRVTGIETLIRNAPDADFDLEELAAFSRRPSKRLTLVLVLLAAWVAVILWESRGSLAQLLFGRSRPPVVIPVASSGTLSVTSNAETHIYVDGRARGVAPGRFTLEEGDHRIELHHVKLGRIERTVTVAAGDALALDVDWSEKTARVSLAPATFP